MGELVRAQPWVLHPARECWVHAGLRCAIVASPLGGWNGYVQLPPGSTWRRRDFLELPVDGLTYGPDPDGWVGFDTGHAWETWAPDDDQPGYMPAWLVDQGATPPPGGAVDHGLQVLRRVRAELARSVPWGVTWTLPMLRARVEALAVRLAVGGG
jgi:hypothetical protein